VAVLGVAAGALETLARPEGWMGTAAQWTLGLGIAVAVLDLLVLGLAWQGLEGASSAATAKASLFLGLVVLPVIVTYFGYQHGFEASKTVESCGACHVMTPFVADLRDPKSESLAAIHYKNRFIREDQCYTCHSDYGMFGTLQAKLEGFGHVVHWVTGTYTVPIKIAHPYSSPRCLACHAESQKFQKVESHPKAAMAPGIPGGPSCLECHGPAHVSERRPG
jgi:cytochrome c nitrite reductase small subunit